MDLEEIRKYCLRKKDVAESLPFDKDSPVYKVCGKIFLIMNLKHPFSINVKCDPEEAIELREKYVAITPGYHMNKIHWNTIELNNLVPSELIFKMIDNSYNLILLSLTNKKKKLK